MLSPPCPPSLIINALSWVYRFTFALNHLPIPSHPSALCPFTPYFCLFLIFLGCYVLICTPTHSFVCLIIHGFHQSVHWSGALIRLVPTYNRCTSVLASVVCILKQHVKDLNMCDFIPKQLILSSLSPEYILFNRIPTQFLLISQQLMKPEKTISLPSLTSARHSDLPCLWAGTWLGFIPVQFERWSASLSLSSGVYISTAQAASIQLARIDQQISPTSFKKKSNVKKKKKKKNMDLHASFW